MLFSTTLSKQTHFLGEKNTQFVDQHPSWALGNLFLVVSWQVLSLGSHTQGKNVAIRREAGRQETRQKRNWEGYMLESIKWIQWAGTLEIPLASKHRVQKANSSFSKVRRNGRRTEPSTCEISLLMHLGMRVIPQVPTYTQLEQKLILQHNVMVLLFWLWTRCSILTGPRVCWHVFRKD